MFEHLPKRVTLVEVGPRDGLQSEQAILATDQKVTLINRLSQTGLSRIEVTSFVSPKWVPQLADAEEVAARFERRPGVIYSALVPNRQGYQKALAAGLDQIVLFLSASESHSRKNINKSIAEALEVVTDLAQAAKQDDKLLRCYLSTAFGCPYEGAVSPDKVVDIASRLLEAGIDQVALGDTTGMANPKQVAELLERLSQAVPLEKVALHVHDTRGLGSANVLAALEAGVTTFDSALGGLGGCPYAPGATGNVATEDLLNLLHGMGIETGVDLDAIIAISLWLEEVLGKPLPSRYLRAHAGSRARS